MQPSHPELRDALTKPKRGLRLFAAERHLELEAAFDALLRDRAAEDPHLLATRWRVLDAAIRDHMDAEEDLIIPGYQLTAPEEGDELRTEHARIRECLDEVFDSRIHVIRRQRLRHLLELLRAHAAREDASMYPWAERNLPLAVRRQLFVRIAHWMRRLSS